MKLKHYTVLVAMIASPAFLCAQTDSTTKPSSEKKKEVPKDPGKQETSTRSTDNGTLNGIAFTYTQGAFELAGATIQTDTVFQLHSGFVIDIDVIPFKVGEETYMRLTYMPYSSGKQSQPGLFESKKNDSPIIHPVRGINGKVLCMLKEDYDTITKTMRYVAGFHWSAIQVVSGQLSAPFKLRPKRTFGADTLAPFRMTTDVTIGIYGGIRWRPSWKESEFFITLPITAGLTFVNVSNNTTSLSQPDGQVAEIVSGFTWSLGLIFQYRRTNFGFVFGRDYASDYGKKWIYHDQTWYSIAIGYSFLRPN